MAWVQYWPRAWMVGRREGGNGLVDLERLGREQRFVGIKYRGMAGTSDDYLSTTSDAPPLWGCGRNKSETEGRAQFFAAFKAYQNPRAHSEHTRTDRLAEFLLQLFRLEGEAVGTETPIGSLD